MTCETVAAVGAVHSDPCLAGSTHLYMAFGAACAAWPAIPRASVATARVRFMGRRCSRPRRSHESGSCWQWLARLDVRGRSECNVETSPRRSLQNCRADDEGHVREHEKRAF